MFLITYAFGCELWAPWSEEFGRKPILQASLFLVNIWTLPVALAPNSPPSCMIADMYESDYQQYAAAYIVFSSVGGSILGPIVGGFVKQYLRWRWTIWIQLIFGVAVQLLHLFTVPESRATIILNKIARKRRNSGQDPNVYGPDEIESFWDYFTLKELMYTWLRPFRMFLTEPIVLTLSLLSGFLYALIFMCIQSFALVYEQWGVNAYQVGLSFIPIGIGYVIAWISFIPAFKRNEKARQRKPDNEHAHAIICIANYAIYMATIDYMICAYGPHFASATSGNGWARDFLAGVLTVPVTPFYANIGAEKEGNLDRLRDLLEGSRLAETVRIRLELADSNYGIEGHRLSVSNHQPRTSVATPPPMRYGDTSRRSSYNASRQAESRLSGRNASRANSAANSAANTAANSRANSVDQDRLRNLDTITSVPTHRLGQ
ncbi:hypothetical protein DL767_009316 [Monosporascus sp. MG133]|nr:hypothetical protein DL767_009316 [Monosporascus sp. MG133]